jgi:hypothetical protein
MLPPNVYIYAGLFAGGLFLGSISAYKITDNYYQAKHAAELTAILEAKEANQKVSAELISDLASKQHQATIQYRTISREIPKYITTQNDTNCNIPADVSRLLNELIQSGDTTGNIINESGKTPSIQGSN